jgi:hypothetical protein
MNQLSLSTWVVIVSEAIVVPIFPVPKPVRLTTKTSRATCAISLQNLVSTLAPSDAALFKRCYNVLQESLTGTEAGGAPATTLPKCITSAFVAGSKGKGKAHGDSPKKSPKRGRDKNGSGAATATLLTVKTTGLPALDDPAPGS